MAKDKHEEAKRKPVGQRKIRGASFIADWASVDAGLLQDAIVSATGMGGAIRFGYTRDGGAYAVGILGDGEPYTLYCGSADDVVATLREIAENLK